MVGSKVILQHASQREGSITLDCTILTWKMCSVKKEAIIEIVCPQDWSVY